jgi:ribonuclease R
MAKSGKIKDPFAKREADKYDNPIPSREFILDYLELSDVPVDYDTLRKDMGLKTDEQFEALRRRLIAMTRDGQLISNRRGVVGLSGRMELIKGLVQGTKDDYGFFIPADGSEDLYLSSSQMRKVFDGDTVLVRESGTDHRGRKEGMIVEVLQRQSDSFVGRYYCDSGVGLVIPANRRISHELLIPENENRKAENGQFVVAQITAFPSSRAKPIAKIVEILGDTTTPGLEIEIAVRSHGLPNQWPSAVKQQIKDINESIPKQEISYRADLRHIPFVTIDGEDAKDFDDAVYAEKIIHQNQDAWKLLVAIADVSNYVSVDSALDEEAINRGNSVYFPGHVIPMLPEQLSNGVCSLKPNEDRLVMVCEMTISADGEMQDYSFCEGIIHSHGRLTYTEVADILEPADTETGRNLQARLQKNLAGLVPHLATLYELYQSLRQARVDAGAMDFDSTETRIVFGENRRIKEIVPVARTCAHRLIEECMLSANVASAKLLQASGLPVLYRVHEGPSSDKLEKLRGYLGELGLTLGGGDKPQPSHYQELLLQISQRDDSHLLQTMVIRSMLQAVYQSENLGHFGLGFQAYTHFTSPIRRYPDLLVHRAIRFLIRNKKNKHLVKQTSAPTIARSQIYPYSAPQMQVLGETCSVTERRADAASYEVIDWLKCEYMQSHVGDEFDSTVASVTGFGLFVELDAIYIEGLVHITALDNDYYHFDSVRHELSGERSGRKYKMGDKIRVKVAAVNLEDRKIDLVLSGVSNKNKHSRKAATKKGRKGTKKARQMFGTDKKESSKPGKDTKKPKSKNKDKNKNKSKGRHKVAKNKGYTGNKTGNSSSAKPNSNS